jgi:hypothetical protein
MVAVAGIPSGKLIGSEHADLTDLVMVVLPTVY